MVLRSHIAAVFIIVFQTVLALMFAAVEVEMHQREKQDGKYYRNADDVSQDDRACAGGPDKNSSSSLNSKRVLLLEWRATT